MIRRHLVAAVVTACVVWSGPAPAASKGGRSRAKGRASSTPAHVKAATQKDGTNNGAHTPSSAALRDARGRILRSAAARHAFALQTGFPNGRPGYAVDHIKPLACGGLDTPSNMRWQTIAAAKANDKVERIGC
jgi:hypothetical protein